MDISILDQVLFANFTVMEVGGALLGLILLFKLVKIFKKPEKQKGLFQGSCPGCGWKGSTGSYKRRCPNCNTEIDS